MTRSFFALFALVALFSVGCTGFGVRVGTPDIVIGGGSGGGGSYKGGGFGGCEGFAPSRCLQVHNRTSGWMRIQLDGYEVPGTILHGQVAEFTLDRRWYELRVCVYDWDGAELGYLYKHARRASGGPTTLHVDDEDLKPWNCKF